MAKSEKKSSDRESFWRAIFNQSRVNGAAYRGDYLPAHSWIWPRGTFLQRRLRSLRAQQLEDAVEQALPGSEELVAAAEKFDRAVSPLHLVKETRSGAHEYSGEESGPPRDSASRTNRGERPRQSPTQALLGLERERWARVSNGATEHVEIDEKSVQAALHKENMEKFQRTLLQSGAWVRATGSEAEELPVAASREVSEPVNRANSAAIKQAQRAAAPVEAEPANSALLAHQAAAPVNNRKVEPTVPPSASRAASSAAPQPIAQSQSELAGWDDIDERLLWLAKPSS